ncbi:MULTISPECIES: hypothetical protein [Streptomyces]|uniref:Uncharacterized protein n=1 Tax=Streptomyces pseudovenezuelae TaxID=67350 RepID=A0A117PMN6_9ACTN|nr:MULTISPECIES: hypothetical protein [Streptomyces]KUM82356.1 hypothetical protein AQI94_42010 [Streptomyces pseudovenezuelae]
MADLAGALDAALRARYRLTEVKTPITQRRGLTARMNQLEKTLSQQGDRKGSAGVRAAKAAGISPRTWERWRKGEQKPGAASVRKLETLFNRLVTLPRTRRALASKGVPNRVTVTAEINWNGYKNRTAYRTTTLYPMKSVMARVIRTWATAGPEAAADVFQSGTAQAHNVPEEPGIQFEGDDVEIEFP